MGKAEQCNHPAHGTPEAAVVGDPCAVQEALDRQASALPMEQRVLLMSCGCWLWKNQPAQRENHARYHPYAWVMNAERVVT